MSSVIIAKIDSICPISGKIEYSVLNEGKLLFGRRAAEQFSLINCKLDEAEVRIAKRHKASLVSDEEFEEFLSIFQVEDEERIARNSAEEYKREEEQFYASLTGVRFKIYNDLGLEGTEWKKAARAIDDEFDKRYRKVEFNPFRIDRNNGWQPFGG